MTVTLAGLDALSPPTNGSVVTIGTFDGVHLGHRALIAKTMEEAGTLNASSVALTWDRHPNTTLRPDRTPPLLTSAPRKIELLEGTGLDVVAVIPFDIELSRWSPERFVEDVLVGGLGARSIFVGEDWRFGHKAEGTVGLLEEMGVDLGFVVHGAPLVEVGGLPVSSSRTRKEVEAGEMAEARVLLGRPFDLDGLVEHGDHRGKDLGFPTANLAVEPTLIEPRLGVYAGIARTGDRSVPAAINVGVNPTFGGEDGVTPRRVEAYLLDFEGDLYGDTLRLEFWQRLRDEEKFESVDDLIAQMARDVARTRELVTC
jgi:riboflavin kinase/FMN adenylyltransferase